MKKRLLLLAVISALLFVGCQNSDTVKKETTETTTTENGTTKTETTTTETTTTETKKDGDVKETTVVKAFDIKDVKTSKEDAWDEFIKKYPDAKVSSFALGEDDGVVKYEIEGFDSANEIDFEINADDKSVIKDEIEADDTKDKVEISKEDLSKIDSFVEKALSESKEEFYAEGFKLGYDDGVKEIEVELKGLNGADKEYKFNFETEEIIGKDN